jgi:hypothetical protein
MAEQSGPLDALAPFVGEWKLLAGFGGEPATDMGARVRIDGVCEICHDGETWEKDFDLAYERVAS